MTRPSDQYRKLGLIQNPFLLHEVASGDQAAYQLEIRAMALLLLRAIDANANVENPAPIWVTKSKVNYVFPLQSVTAVQYFLVNDESLNLFYSYVQLFMLKNGRIASTLQTVGERVALADFHKTLEAYIAAEPFANPDTTLESYELLGAETFDRLRERFTQSPEECVIEWFGKPGVFERNDEFGDFIDMRARFLETDIETEQDGEDEVGDLPALAGTGIELSSEDVAEQRALSEASDAEIEGALISDYIVSYVREHLSPVLARGIIGYRDRGLDAVIGEFKVTRAPRKTLAALVKFAMYRRRSGVMVYDGFEQWNMVEPEIRQKIAVSMTEMRLSVQGMASMVFLMEPNLCAELEDLFGHQLRVDWDFAGLAMVEPRAKTVSQELVNRWLAAASLDEGAPLSLETCPALGALYESCEHSIDEFIGAAYTAIEDAVERGVTELDERSVESGMAVLKRA